MERCELGLSVGLPTSVISDTPPEKTLACCKAHYLCGLASKNVPDSPIPLEVDKGER